MGKVKKFMRSLSPGVTHISGINTIPYGDEAPLGEAGSLFGSGHQSPHDDRTISITARKTKLAKMAMGAQALARERTLNNPSENIPSMQRGILGSASARNLYNGVMIEPDVNIPAPISFNKNKKIK
jgi:hypothetical protein